MSGLIDYSKINLSVLPKGDNVVKATPKRVPIDYSKIDLKGTLPKATALTTPAKGRLIDYNAIKGPVVATPAARPVVKSSTPFISRPFVTPAEQQRMKAANGQSNLYNPSSNPIPAQEQSFKAFGKALGNDAAIAFDLWEAQGTRGVNDIIYWVNDLLIKTGAPVIGKKDYAEENRKYAALQANLASKKAKTIMASIPNNDWDKAVVTAFNGGLSLLQSIAMGMAVQGGAVVGDFLSYGLQHGGAIAVGQLAKTQGYKAAITAVKHALDGAASRVGISVAASVLPAWISSGIEGGSIYRELTDQGKSPLRASVTALTSIAGTALSESIELAGMYHTWSKNLGSEVGVRLMNALGQATSQTAQELGQNLWQNGVRMAIGRDDTQKLATIKETIDTIIGIFPASFLFGAGTFNAQSFRQQNTEEARLATDGIIEAFGVDKVTAGKMLDEAITKWGPTIRDTFLYGIDAKKVKLADALKFVRSSDPYAQWLTKEITKPTAEQTPLAQRSDEPITGSPAVATPAHGLIDYSSIELNGIISQASSKVLSDAEDKGKGFDNYIQNTAGTKDTSLSPFAKLKEIGDRKALRFVNQFGGLMKTPLGAKWMTLAIEADEVLRQEYARPFSIDETGEQVYVKGEFAPAILNRYLKQYGPNFGKFLQHLQRAGIPIEATKGLGADKKNLAQQHIADSSMNLVNFQKNEPQLFTAYMAAANELGEANRLLPEFYKGIISPETYANEKANPNYYVSLSAGKTDRFDRSGVAPLERTHGLTDLEHVVEPLEGLKAVYVDAIRAMGINNAKREAVRSNKNSEVATTELSDSIVHLKENGVDRAYDVHDTNVTKSIRNLTLTKPEVSTVEKWLLRNPTTTLRLFATGLNPAFGLFNIIRDVIQSIGTAPFTPRGLIKGTARAFKSPGLSQWFDSYRDPTMAKGARATEAIKKIVEILTFPNEIGESLVRSVVAESIIDRGGSYLDQLHGYYASTGFFALHGTFFNDFLASCIPFTQATIAVVRAAYHNAFLGLPIGDKGGTFSWKQGAEKLAGRNLATIIFTIVSALAIKEAGKEKEYKLLRDRASYFYFPTPSGAWVKLPVPIGFVPIKGIVDSLFGYKSDPMDVAGQTLNVLPGLQSFLLSPGFALFLQLKFNINFFTGAEIDTAVGTPAANPLEAGIMKVTGWTEERAAFVVRSFFADIPSQVQYVFDMVGQGSSAQAFPLSKRFIVKDPTTSSNAAVDDFYAFVDVANRSSNPALKHYVNVRANWIGKLLHNAKLYPADAKIYMTTATDNIIATFATIAENPSDYGFKFGPFSWQPKGNYEELNP